MGERSEFRGEFDEGVGREAGEPGGEGFREVTGVDFDVVARTVGMPGVAEGGEEVKLFDGGKPVAE